MGYLFIYKKYKTSLYFYIISGSRYKLNIDTSTYIYPYLKIKFQDTLNKHFNIFFDFFVIFDKKNLRNVKYFTFFQAKINKVLE